MVAALLTLIVNATPAPGVHAALPALAGSLPTDGIPSALDTSTPSPAPLPSQAPAATDAPTFVTLADPPADSPAPSPTPDPTPPEVVAPSPSPDPAAGVAAPSPAPDAAAPSSAPAAVVSPAPRPTVRAAARPARLWAQLRRGLTVRGSASWYYGTRGYAGIPHVAMPGARFLVRGKTVPRARVCAGNRCIVVRVVDYCGCYVGTRRSRVVDLSTSALHRLGLDPRRGVYRVRVTLLRS